MRPLLSRTPLLCNFFAWKQSMQGSDVITYTFAVLFFCSKAKHARQWWQQGPELICKIKNVPDTAVGGCEANSNNSENFQRLELKKLRHLDCKLVKFNQLMKWQLQLQSRSQSCNMWNQLGNRLARIYWTKTWRPWLVWPVAIASLAMLDQPWLHVIGEEQSNSPNILAEGPMS